MAALINVILMTRSRKFSILRAICTKPPNETVHFSGLQQHLKIMFFIRNLRLTMFPIVEIATTRCSEFERSLRKTRGLEQLRIANKRYHIFVRPSDSLKKSESIFLNPMMCLARFFLSAITQASTYLKRLRS